MHKENFLTPLQLFRLLGGQFLSLVASGTSQFALGIWAFQLTHEATSLTLLTTAFLTPFLVLSPIAGTLADKVSKKRLMFIGDIVSATTALITLLLHQTGQLELWHLYGLAALNGSAQTFHWPAYSAATSELVHSKHYGRVHGFTSLAENGAKMFAPAIGGLMLTGLGLPAILLCNVIGSSLAALMLLSIPMPHLVRSAAPRLSTLLREALEGLYYIIARPALLQLQFVFFLANFFLSMAASLVPAYVLAVTNHDVALLGAIQSAGAIGGIVGAVAMGIWGGANRLVPAMLIFWVGVGILGVAPLGVVSSPLLMAMAICTYTFFGPMIGGCSQALWQRKIALHVQGRVFAIRRLIAWAAGPLGAACAGPLADNIFEPAQRSSTPFQHFLGNAIGNRPGAGIGVLIVMAGICIAIVGLVALSRRDLREINDSLPDLPLTTPGLRPGG